MIRIEDLRDILHTLGANIVLHSVHWASMSPFNILNITIGLLASICDNVLYIQKIDLSRISGVFFYKLV